VNSPSGLALEGDFLWPLPGRASRASRPECPSNRGDRQQRRARRL